MQINEYLQVYTKCVCKITAQTALQTHKMLFITLLNVNRLFI